LSAAFGTEQVQSVLAAADDAYPNLAARIPASQAGARHLLRTSAYVIAMQRALVEHGLEEERANALLSDMVFASIIPARTALHRISALRHRDPLRRAAWGSRIARRLYYAEPGWVIQDVPVPGGFGMDITRCAVAEYFDSVGMNQLCQTAICDQDVRSATHHGIVLERSGTLATGADRCDFRYSVPATPQHVRRARSAPSEKMAGTLEDSVSIDASPESVWSWLAALVDHYAEWHPDHVSAEWIAGEPNQVGSRLKAIEVLGGHREELVFEMTDIDPPRRMDYRIRGPHSIILPGGSFSISARGDGSTFRASIRYRGGRAVAAVFRRRLGALRSHMHEEGVNLKRLVESAS
jgi:hypothetical protein